MNSKQKLLNLLGLARRADKLVTGEDTVLKAVQNRKVQLVFFAKDGGNSTKKKINNKTQSYKIAFSSILTRQEITDAIGMARSLVAISDRGFSEKMKEYLKQEEENQ